MTKSGVVDKSMIIKCMNVFNSNWQYAEPDKAINRAVKDYSNNTDFAEVILKATLINSIYSTQIFDILSMANHIVNIVKLNNMLNEGDKRAVDCIRIGAGIIVKKSGKERDNYSFATKYCSFHNPNKYPIYDSAISNLLIRANKDYKWISKITDEKLGMNFKEYSYYVDFLDKFLETVDIDKFGYREADKGLWIYAKYCAALAIPANKRTRNDKALIRLIDLD